MNCPKCKKKMVLKRKDFSYNSDEKKYARKVYWCKDDDIWISLEVPSEDKN